MLANKRQRGGKEPANTSKENNELVSTLRKEVEDLKSQRNQQLATKDRQIDHLTKLIDQQQQLQLATVAENRQLKEQVQKLLEQSRKLQLIIEDKIKQLEATSSEVDVEEEKEESKKKGFWNKLWEK